MDQFQEKLGAILNDPQMMQQIMSLAQSVNTQPSTVPQPPPAETFPKIDPGMLQKLAALASQSGMDRDQQALLTALTPYLHASRIHRLEKAMRAAKTARLATGILGKDPLSIFSGR